MSRFRLSQTIVGLTIVLWLGGGCGWSLGISLIEAPAASPIPKPPPSVLLSAAGVPQTIDLRWNTSPAARIIRYYSPDTSAGMAGAYNHAYYLPEVQVWGDGRIIWVTYEGSERRLREGQLTTEQMKTLLQRLVEAGFFAWEDEYYTLGGNSTPPMRLSVSLIGQSKDVQEHGGAPEAYYKFVEWLTHGAGIRGSEYAPKWGYLTARCWPDIATITTPVEWLDTVAGFTLAQVGQGRYIEGEVLAFAWQVINKNPAAPVYVKSGDQDCVMMVQIPGLSFFEPPPATPTPLPAGFFPLLTPPASSASLNGEASPAPPPPCDSYYAEVEFSASATTLRAGQTTTITVTLRNKSCSRLGLPHYSLQAAPSLFEPLSPARGNASLGGRAGANGYGRVCLAGG